jgi:hypothetical protein
MKITKEIAECVGLWLAEGDSKTTREITFTNNCIELILFFHENVFGLYKGVNKPRLYVYSPTNRIMIKELNGFKIRNYTDIRAKRTYYIYRLADVKFVKEWKKLVEIIKTDKNLYSQILRGIFAGEGNIKHDLKNNNTRNIRIASGKRNKFIDLLLTFFKIPIKYDPNKGSYWINARYLPIADKINIASLHPEKQSKFKKMILCLKEKHFSPNEFRSLILSELNDFKKTKNLAFKYERSQIRVLEILTQLKKEGHISNIKTKEGSFWAKKKIIEEFLFKEKVNLLHNIKKHKSFRHTGKVMNLSRKYVASKIRQFEKEGLLINENNEWNMTQKGKIVVGVDESGSEY